MFIRYRLLVTILVLSTLTSTSVSSQCNDTNFAFKAGEVISYDAYYNWGFIWLNAGRVTFSVQKTTVNNQAAYFIKSVGATINTYDALYRVRDTFEVKTDTLYLNPFTFRQVTNEGSTKATYNYTFNRDKRTITASIKKDKEPVKNTNIPWKNCSFDVLTMVYKARNIDFSTHKTGDKIPLNMLVDGEIHAIYIRYLGKETIETRDGRKFNCLKFTPMLVKGTIFESGENMTVWVTDDKNRVPVVVEAEILIGTVKAVFTGAKNLRYPLSAEVKK